MKSKFSFQYAYFRTWLVSMGITKLTDIHKFWWDITKEERIWIIKQLNYFYVGGKVSKYWRPDLRPSVPGKWHKAQCLRNSQIKWFTLANWPDHEVVYKELGFWGEPEVGSQRCDLEYCKQMDSEGTVRPALPKFSFFLPCHMTTCMAGGMKDDGKIDLINHSICAMQIDHDTKDFYSWFFFQYNDVPIVPWEGWQIKGPVVKIVTNDPYIIHHTGGGYGKYGRGEPYIIAEWDLQEIGIIPKDAPYRGVLKSGKLPKRFEIPDELEDKKMETEKYFGNKL